MLLGAPEAVVAHGVVHESGVDVEESVLLRYRGGRSALLFASLRSPAPGEARVLGTSGWIQVPPRFHYPNRIVLHRYGHDPETIDARLTGTPRTLPSTPMGAGCVTYAAAGHDGCCLSGRQVASGEVRAEDGYVVVAVVVRDGLLDEGITQAGRVGWEGGLERCSEPGDPGVERLVAPLHEPVGEQHHGAAGGKGNHRLGTVVCF